MQEVRIHGGLATPLTIGLIIGIILGTLIGLSMNNNAMVSHASEITATEQPVATER